MKIPRSVTVSEPFSQIPCFPSALTSVLRLGKPYLCLKINVNATSYCEELNELMGRPGPCHDETNDPLRVGKVLAPSQRLPLATQLVQENRLHRIFSSHL